MLERGLVVEVLAAARRHGGDFAEVFVEERSSTSVRLDDGHVEELTTGLDRGAGVRVCRGTTYGYAYSNRLDRASLLEAAAAASAALAGDAPGPVVDLTRTAGRRHEPRRATGRGGRRGDEGRLAPRGRRGRAWREPRGHAGHRRLLRLAAAATDRDERRPLGAGGPPAHPPVRPGGREARRRDPDRMARAGRLCGRRVPRPAHAERDRAPSGAARGDDAGLDPCAGRRDGGRRGQRLRRRAVPRGGGASAGGRRRRQGGERLPRAGRPAVLERR